MKPASFDYARPRDVDDAVALLAKAGGEAKLLAGGQSLGPMLNLRLARPGLLIDVSRLDSLRRIEETREAWCIGGGVTHAALEDAVGRMPGGEMLCAVAGGIAYRSVRNRGTIGGSLAHADPAADWPLALAALGAVIIARGPGGKTRRLAAEGFMTGTFATVLEPAEIIEWVEVPKLPPDARTGYFKFCRKAGEFPEASAAAVIDRVAKRASVYMGALDGPPVPLPDLARVALERPDAAPARETVDAAVASAAPGLDPVARRMHAGAVMRALHQALAP